MSKQQLPDQSISRSSAVGLAADDVSSQQQQQQASTASGPAGDAAVRRIVGSDASSVATSFYQSFAGRDIDAMQKGYDPSVQFQDPLFGHLHGAQVMEMWSAILPKA